MSERWDAIVIGAGTNSLTCAALLAERGLRTLVLEARDVTGGMAATEEFHEDFRTAGLLHDTTGVRPAVVERLGLTSHGLWRRPQRPDIIAAHAGETRTVDGAPKDGPLAKYRQFIDSVRGVLSTFYDEPPVNLVDIDTLPFWELLKRGLRLRALGKAEMLELLRLPPMCSADWLNEWFDDDVLKSALSVPSVAGTWSGPWSPGTNANLLLWEAAATGDVTHLAESLDAAARARGAEIRTGARVEAIRANGAVQGVTLADGEALDAPVVVSGCDPTTTLVRMLPPSAITFQLEQRLHNFRKRGTTAQLLLALKGPLPLEAEYVRTGGHLDHVERAFDAVKYRRFSSEPILDVHLPTMRRSDLAPEGHHVANVHIHFAPYHLDGGWSREARERLTQTALDTLEKHVPGMRDCVQASVLRTPVDIEEIYGTAGGHIHHGEHALDQLLVRPAPEVIGYRTPVQGLYLCGAGNHPGGGLTCAPGLLAAAAVS